MKGSLKMFTPERMYFNKKTKKVGRSLSEVYDRNRLSSEGLKWYLEMGFVPGTGTLFEDIEVYSNTGEINFEDGDLKINEKLCLENLIDFNIHEGKSEGDLVKEGGLLFNEVINKLFNETDKQVILPITSGLDSRMILGGLLNCTEAKNICTFTWGLPNTLDFEVSKKITSKLGIKHHAFDISKYRLTEDRLRRFADMSDCSVTLFDHWPIDWVKEITNKNEGAIWMGLLGGTLSGSNIPKSFAENPYVSFLKDNNRIPSLTSLSASLLNTRPNIQDLKLLTSDFKEINYDTLDIYFHHENLIAPTKLHRSFDYILPFTDPKLLSFFLSLPIKYRNNRTLLKDMILFHYPGLARFPSNRNNGLGLDIRGKKRGLIKKYYKFTGNWDNLNKRGKYISLENYMIEDLQLKNLVLTKLRKLENRNIVDNKSLSQIKNEFFGNNTTKIDHSRALDVLVSLEIILELVNY